MDGTGNMDNQSTQTQIRGIIAGIRSEIYSRYHKPSKKASADTPEHKISRIVAYFSDTTDKEEIFAGPVVDTYLQCTKNEIGIIVPLAYKEDIVPLLMSLPWSYREFIKLNQQ